MVAFNHSLRYLRQHPGLNAALALQLFPLTSGEMIVTHSKSLLKLKIYDKEYKEKDLVGATNEAGQLAGKRYQDAAARIEQVLTFLCGKNHDVLAGLIRGEAFRLKSTFDSDYRELFNYYSVCYDFKNRLKFVLRQRLASEAPQAAQYIESCLLNRESSADYLLSLLCCSIGRLASVDYNKSLEFEDLNTKRSAHSMLDSGKILLMSLLSENKRHKAEHSVSLSSKQREKLSSRCSMASLTVIDRDQSRLTERTLPTVHEDDKKLNSLGVAMTRAQLLQGKVNKSDSIKLINFAFKTRDLSKLDPRHEKQIGKILAMDSRLCSSFTAELAVMLSLFHYCLQVASDGDQYFKSSYLTEICAHFELGLVNAHLYMASKYSKSKEMASLILLVNKHNLENVATVVAKETNEPSLTRSSSSSSNSKRASSQPGRTQKKPESPTSSSSKVTKNNSRDSRRASKQLRHLIELLNVSLEAYYELNCLLNYPSAKLNAHINYNPILIHNLSLFSYNNPNNKILFKY